MELFIRIKAAGKRRDILERRPYTLPDSVSNAGALIEALVRDNVRAYNQKTIDAPFFPCLTQRELDAGAYIGKIGFSDRKNESVQDEDEAVANALQCFEDGLFRLLINETELDGIDAATSLQAGDTITIIRLTMLAGRLW